MKKINKKYIVLQDGIKECGSACLLSIIRYYQGNISMDRLLELTNTTKEGTNFYYLQQAANEIGLTAKGYKLDSLNKLDEFDKPFISQIVINNYSHFIVVYKIKNNIVTIMDPAKGMVSVSLSSFESIWTGYILVMSPDKKLPIYEDENYVYNLIKKVINDNRRLIINLMSLTIIVTIFTCLYSYHFKIIIDNIINTNKLNLTIISVIFIIILFIKLLVEYLRNNLLLYLNQKIDLSIITTTIERIIFLPYSYYKNKTTGETISRINDLLYIKNVISKIIITIFLDVFMSLIALVILLTIDKTATSLLLIITIVYFLIFLIYKNSIQKMTDTIQEDNAKVNSLLVESISSYETIKGLNLEKKFKNKINKQYLNTITNNLNLTRLSNTEEFLKDLFEGIIIIFAIYLGVTHIMDKSLTIGSLVTYNTLLFYFITPIRNIFDFYKEFYYVKNSIKRINNILNFKYDKLDKQSNLEFFGDITIKNLKFSYNQRKAIINDISLIIPSSKKVLLLGPSGTGKSTLLKILYRYYEVPRDKIYINHYDINDFCLQDIRNNITYISQNELLLTDTIKNNIILDRVVEEKEFINVCRITKVDEIITKNNISYDYVLEENGANLSGGQRQRIILARALLKKSKIILIDEGLNEIDIIKEREILKNIFSYYQDKTIIIVSHRKDNMDLYNQVINLEAGRIKEVINNE